MVGFRGFIESCNDSADETLLSGHDVQLILQKADQVLQQCCSCNKLSVTSTSLGFMAFGHNLPILFFFPSTDLINVRSQSNCHITGLQSREIYV